MGRGLHSKKFQKRVWIVLAVIVIPPFIFWGAGSLMRNRSGERDYIGTVFGRKVSIAEFRDAYTAVKNRIYLQLGEETFASKEKDLNLEGQAWEWIILLQEAKKRRITVSDKEVIDAIASEFSVGKYGFDERVYNEILYRLRCKPREFEEQTRQRLKIGKLSDDVTKNIRLTDEEIREEYRKAHEEVSLTYIAGIAGEFAKGISPAEEELKDYFSKNSLDFRKPLSFNMEYASIPAQGKSEETLNQLIQAAYTRLRKKEPFEKVAKEMGLTLQETGLFGENDPIPGIGWNPISVMISKAKVGEYLNPVYANNAYFLLKLKERKDPYIPEFEAVKGKVKEAYIKVKSQEIARGKIEECLAKIKEESPSTPGGVDLEKIAQAVGGVKSGVTESFKFGSYIEGIGASDEFWLKARQLKDKETSDIFTTSAGYYIFTVKARKEIDEKKFGEEKEAFAKQLLAQRKLETFGLFVEDLRAKSQRY